MNLFSPVIPDSKSQRETHNLSTLLNVHGNTELVLDTIDAIKQWVTNDVLVIIDGASWHEWGKTVKLPVHKMEGLRHAYGRNPYRNITLGLENCIKLFPDADWVCYCEYDTLFLSSDFKEDLENCPDDVWMLGCDKRDRKCDLPLLDKLVNIENGSYLAAFCWFFRMEFLQKLQSLNFFQKFLHLTNDMAQGFFPRYSEWDLAEYVYPSLVTSLGGKVGELACFNNYDWRTGEPNPEWRGNYLRYPMRALDNIDFSTLDMDKASVYHPSKSWDGRIREMARVKRSIVKSLGEF